MSAPRPRRWAYAAPMKLTWSSAFVAIVLAVGCSGTPTQPSPPSPSVPLPPVSPAPPNVTNQSKAAIVAEDAFAIVHRVGSAYGYEVRFLLRETGNLSGATVTNVAVYGPTGIDNAGPGCWRDPLYVEPLGRLDTFYTSEGSAWLSYCGPGSGGTTRTPTLHVIVSFTDDSGVAGSIGFPITALR